MPNGLFSHVCCTPSLCQSSCSGWQLPSSSVSFVPSLEEVGQERSVTMSPGDAPSVIALRHIGRAFNEGTTDSVAMIVIEGDKPLGDDAHRYYDTLIRRLREDRTHVLSIQDFWGDPLTASGAQSNDAKAATVQVNLGGNQGEPLANESIEAVRKIVDSTPAPPGVKAYVTGASALTADMHQSGDKSMVRITATTLPGDSDHVAIRLSLRDHRDSAAGHGRFRIGHRAWSRRGGRAHRTHRTFHLRGQPAHLTGDGGGNGLRDIRHRSLPRSAPGRRREGSGLLHHVSRNGPRHPGSGLTIAGATFCLSFARSPYFKTLGIPCAVGMVTAVVVALTLAPAILTVGRPIRCVRPQAEIERPGMAADRYRGGSLAVAHPRRQLRRGPGRPAHTARV